MLACAGLSLSGRQAAVGAGLLRMRSRISGFVSIIGVIKR
jgi:hypothetical protein